MFGATRPLPRQSSLSLPEQTRFESGCYNWSRRIQDRESRNLRIRRHRHKQMWSSHAMYQNASDHGESRTQTFAIHRLKGLALQSYGRTCHSDCPKAKIRVERGQGREQGCQLRSQSRVSRCLHAGVQSPFGQQVLKEQGCRTSWIVRERSKC